MSRGTNFTMEVVNIERRKKAMLIKLNLDEMQVAKLDELKDLCQHNTGSKAVMFSLENFCSLQKEYETAIEERDAYKYQLEELKQLLGQKAEAELQIKAMLMP